LFDVHDDLSRKKDIEPRRHKEHEDFFMVGLGIVVNVCGFMVFGLFGLNLNHEDSMPLGYTKNTKKNFKIF
jgi:hypothetical protein